MSDRDGHDWLCPYSPIAQSGCKCPWINQARADERERIAQAIEYAADELDWDSAIVAATGELIDVRNYGKTCLHEAARIAREGA